MWPCVMVGWCNNFMMKKSLILGWWKKCTGGAMWPCVMVGWCNNFMMKKSLILGWWKKCTGGGHVAMRYGGLV